MKLNKTITTLLLTIIILVQCASLAHAVNETERSFTTTLTAVETNVNVNELIVGDEFEVAINIGDFKNIEKGLYAIQGKLEYSTDILELVLVGKDNNKIINAQNGWADTTENNETFKFVTTGDNITEPGIMGKIKFRVKEVEEPTEGSIKLTQMCVSDGENDIESADAILNVTVAPKKEEPPVLEDKLTSEVYTVEENMISRVELGTTISKFKTNIESQGTLVFKDKNGNVITDESTKIATETTVEVGTTLKFTICVTGDVDSNGEASVTDLAKIMTHIVETETLQGIQFKAADMNGDGKITVTDVAQMQLVLVGLPVEE